MLRPMICSRDLSRMPSLEVFRRLVRSLAALDAVMSPEWCDRYYSFDPSWGEGEMMASMRNGSGDHWFAVICAAGVALVGLDHESESYQPGEPHPAVFADLPAAFKAPLLDEPAFDCSNATFCIWREASDACWHSGATKGRELPAHDGSAELLAILEGLPEQYVAFASEYYECELQLSDVQAIYDHRPIDAQLIASLNPEADADEVEAACRGIGYPER